LAGAALGDGEVCGAFDLLHAANARSRVVKRRFFIEIEL